MGTRGKMRGESGATFVELSLVLPAFLLLFALLVDVGMLLQQYYTLSQLAYQGSRLMSDTPDLEVATFEREAPYGTVHYEVQNKINRMIQEHGRKLRGEVSVTTRRWQAETTVERGASPRSFSRAVEKKEKGGKGPPSEERGAGKKPDGGKPIRSIQSDMVEVQLEMPALLFFRAIWGDSTRISASSTGPFLFVAG